MTYDPNTDPRWFDENDLIPEIGESPEVRETHLLQQRDRLGQMLQVFEFPGWDIVAGELGVQIAESYERLRRADDMNTVVKFQARIAVLEDVLTLPQRAAKEMERLNADLHEFIQEG